MSQQQSPESPSPVIAYEDFAKVELRVGTVAAAERVPKSDKLLRLTVDLGEEQPRTIVAGIGKTFTEPANLVGQQFIFVANLAPRKVFGVESHGMILATGDDPSSLVLATVNTKLAPGSQLR